MLPAQRSVADAPDAHVHPPADGPLARLSVPRPVNRYTYVPRLCRGLRVLDLGAYDETEVESRQHRTWRWLHAEIAKNATEVLGVDASEAVRVAGIVQTPVGTKIVFGVVEELEEIATAFKPDIVVAGELIEHTADTLGWLRRLSEVLPGTRFVATTPNSTSILNLGLGLVGRESTHPDHLQIYSYRTLRTLFGRVPLVDAKITPYYYNRHLFYPRVPRVMYPAVTLTDLLFMRPVQWMFPLLSIGMIIEGYLGRSPVPHQQPGD
jgi:hypothetical protein